MFSIGRIIQADILFKLEIISVKIRITTGIAISLNMCIYV